MELIEQLTELLPIDPNFVISRIERNESEQDNLIVKKKLSRQTLLYKAIMNVVGSIYLYSNIGVLFTVNYVSIRIKQW